MNSPAMSMFRDMEGLHVFQVLLGDPFDRNVINIHFVSLDQVKQKIERPFKDLEFDLIVHKALPPTDA